MRIGELAARTGASVRSLRYYEEQGLLVSTRSPGGQRHFTEQDIERVDFVRRLFTAGLSSRTIMELMPCRDAPSDENSDTALDRMALERDRLSAHIEELLSTRDSLDGLISAARADRDTRQTAAA